MSLLSNLAPNVRAIVQRAFNPIHGDVRAVRTCIETVSGDTNTSAANANVQIVYPAQPYRTHLLSGIAWSYDDTPTGRLTVDYEGHHVFDVDITQGGPGFIPFPAIKAGRIGLACTITLYAGGQGIVGKLNVLNHWTE